MVRQAREFEEERAKAAAAQEAASAQAKDLQAEVERVEEHQVRRKAQMGSICGYVRLDFQVCQARDWCAAHVRICGRFCMLGDTKGIFL